MCGRMCVYHRRNKHQAFVHATSITHTQRGPQYKVKLTAHEALARAEASHFVDPADAAFMEQVRFL